MKKLLPFLFLAITATTSATNYYISATGNDAAAGTSPATAWRSPNKINSITTFAAGDSILLQRGDTFNIQFSILPLRNNLFFDAYGTGPMPLISGMVTATGWQLYAPGIYRIAAPAARPSLTVVTINGRPQQIGRWPNADDVNWGYRSFQNVGSWYIEDNTLPSSPDWTGATAVIRGTSYTANPGVITQVGNGRINYRFGRNINVGTTPLFDVVKQGFSYFLQNALHTLDKPGEWFLDSAAKYLYIFTGNSDPNLSVIQYAVADTLFTITGRNNITIKNIRFEGANHTAVLAQNSDNVTVQDVQVANVVKGVQMLFVGNAIVKRCSADFCLSTSYQLIARSKKRVTVDSCSATRNGYYVGMGSYYSSADNKAIYATADSFVTVTNNFVDSTALAAIQVGGSVVRLSKNVARHFCLRLDDGGGLYMYAGVSNPQVMETDRIIDSNIVMDGCNPPPANLATTDTTRGVTGIYLDGVTMNVLVKNNTIINPGKNGIHSNNGTNITIRDNTVYNAQNAVSAMDWDYATISNLQIKKNILYATHPAQKGILYTNDALNYPTPTTFQQAVRSLGNIDSNAYSSIPAAAVHFLIRDNIGGKQLSPTPMALSTWQSFSGFEKNSFLIPNFPAYKLDSTIGTNRVVNGTFDKSTASWILFGSNTTFTQSNAMGRFAFNVPTAGRWSMIHQQIGAVSSAKKYLVRFNTAGTAPGLVRAYFRNTTTYVDITPRQTLPFTNVYQQHEILLNAPTTVTKASLCIEVEQNSGTTFIDNVQLFEASATVNTLQNYVSIYVNDHPTPITFSFNKLQTDAYKTPYRYSVTVPGFSSRLLFLQQVLTATSSNVIIRSRL